MTSNRSHEEIIITYVPYGSKEAGLTPDELNNSRQFENYFQDALIPKTEDSKSADRNIEPCVYIYPRIQDISGNLAKDNVEVLTQSPVVYVVTLDQDEHMLSSKWLANLVGDNAKDTYGLYKCPHIVYVGETNNILARTNQHLTPSGHFGNIGGEETYEDISLEVDERTLADRVIQKAVVDNISVHEYIVWNTYFTKSMTLDLENKFIDYFHAHDGVYLLNGRGNPQRYYYKSEEKDAVCSRVWQLLSAGNPDLFPPEQDIWNSELYKVSPFHALGKEQIEAVSSVCESVVKLLDGEPIQNENLDDDATSPNRLVILEGASGTGKSIVLSTLFVRLSEVLRERTGDESTFGIQTEQQGLPCGKSRSAAHNVRELRKENWPHAKQFRYRQMRIQGNAVFKRREDPQTRNARCRAR